MTQDCARSLLVLGKARLRPAVDQGLPEHVQVHVASNQVSHTIMSFHHQKACTERPERRKYADDHQQTNSQGAIRNSKRPRRQESEQLLVPRG